MEEKPVTVNVFQLADALKAKPKPLKNAGKCSCLLLQCLKKKKKKHLLDSMPTHLPIFVSARFYMRALRNAPRGGSRNNEGFNVLPLISLINGCPPATSQHYPWIKDYCLILKNPVYFHGAKSFYFPTWLPFFHTGPHSLEENNIFRLVFLQIQKLQ